jgi:hypothetical protein
MAAKTKAKKAARKPPLRPRPAKAPTVVVPNHRFAPGTKVAFLPTYTITVERSMRREPFAKPIKTAKVKKDGTLEVAGLAKGQWSAAGPVEDGARWAYVGFAVK